MSDEITKEMDAGRSDVDSQSREDTGAVPEDDAMLPIKPPLQALNYKTINKKFGWWAAVVLLRSYAKKQICFYLWQRKGDEWRRKQKFGIHSKEDWALIKNAVESYIGELE